MGGTSGDSLDQKHATDPSFIATAFDGTWRHPQPPWKVTDAVNSLKNNKAPVADQILAEVLKRGGYPMWRHLHSLQRYRPLAFSFNIGKMGIICPSTKKCDWAVCGNSRAISLLSGAGKVVGYDLLDHLFARVGNIIMPESQSRFRTGEDTNDMAFAVKLQ